MGIIQKDNDFFAGISVSEVLDFFSCVTKYGKGRMKIKPFLKVDEMTMWELGVYRLQGSGSFYGLQTHM